MTETLPPPAAVIFDCDGVVVQHNRLDFGPLTDRMVDPPDRSRLRTLFADGTEDSFVARAKTMDATLPEAFLRSEFHRVLAHLAANSRIVPGILTVLDTLEATGIPFALCSNGPLLKMQISLARHDGLGARFGEHVYSGQIWGVAKPSPKFFLRPARCLGVRPRECAIVDDGISGVIAGVAAGMRTFCYGGEGNSRALASEQEALADYDVTLFHAMTDLPNLLGL